MTPGGRDRAASARGAAVLAWIALGAAYALALSEAAGLKYLQEIIWPTALYTYERAALGGVDVALVGSSRASFGLAPTALDPCLQERLGRPIRSVNISRVYADIITERILVRDLLEASPPEVLVVEMAPEILNNRHHEATLNMAWNAGWQDTPACLRGARGSGELGVCARPLFRGVENLAQLIHGGYREDDHLSWMMLHHRGGQFCYGSAACEAHNADYRGALSWRWAARAHERLLDITEERFGDWAVGEGDAHAYLLDLLAWAEAADVAVRLVNMPVHALYQERVPPAAQATFAAYLDDLTRDRPADWYDANTPAWNAAEGIWIDPDHLDPVGAERLSRELCEAVIAPALAGR